MFAVLEVLRALLPLMYALTSVLYLIFFTRQRSAHQCVVKKLLTPVFVLTAITHISYSILRGIAFGHHPMASFHEILSIIALALAVVYLIVETWRKNKSTGVFVLPLVFVLQMISAIGIEPTHEINPILRETPFGMHTGTLTLSYSSFFLCAVYAVMYLLFHRALRKKKFGLIFQRFPSLDVLARMNRGAAGVGLIFMTVGIICGLIWAWEKVPLFWNDPKIIGTIIVWFFYAFALLGHYGFKWSGRKIAILTLMSFVLLICVSFIANVFFPGWHQFRG